MKKLILGAIVAFLMLTLLCACGSGAGEPSTTEAQTPSTVTAGEAAGQVDTDADAGNVGADAQDTEPGTEDGAMDAALAAAYEDIKGFDGSWQNLSLDVDEPMTTIEFDWNGKHYTYQYDEDAGKIVR